MRARSMTLAILLSAAASSSVMADTVDMHFVGTGEGRNVRLHKSNGDQNVFAGQLIHQITAGTGSGVSLIGTHTTFCPDIFQHVTSSGATYTLVGVDALPDSPMQPAMGLSTAQFIYDLSASLSGLQFEAGAGNDLAAAYQIAVWEIVSDYNPMLGMASVDLNAGNLRITNTDNSPINGGTLAAYTQLLAMVGSGSSGAGFVGLASGSAQDQIVMIPAPGSAIAGLGVLALAARRRRGC